MEMLLKELMTPDPECVSAKDKLIDLKHIFERKNFHHHIPVTDSGKVIGMISLIDFMHALGNASLDEDEPVYQKSVSEIMTHNVVSLGQDLPIEEALKIFLKNEIHAIPVVSQGKIVGIVTSSDMLKYFAQKDS
ncbi:MAG: hypothetical protein RIT43_1198 [Bacteroidota bacterium]|jgi:CBS domain-containing protein